VQHLKQKSEQEVIEILNQTSLNASASSAHNHNNEQQQPTEMTPAADQLDTTHNQSTVSQEKYDKTDQVKAQLNARPSEQLQQQQAANGQQDKSQSVVNKKPKTKAKCGCILS